MQHSPVPLPSSFASDCLATVVTSAAGVSRHDDPVLQRARRCLQVVAAGRAAHARCLAVSEAALAWSWSAIGRSHRTTNRIPSATTPVMRLPPRAWTPGDKPAAPAIDVITRRACEPGCGHDDGGPGLSKIIDRLSLQAFL